MGFRFRKNIKICKGLKVNINKNSISLTAGSKGAKYTVNSKGKKTASVGVPGTGLYYTKSTSSSPSKNKKARKYYTNSNNNFNFNNSNNSKFEKNLTNFFIFTFIFLFFVVILISFTVNDTDNNESVAENQPSIETEDNPNYIYQNDYVDFLYDNIIESLNNNAVFNNVNVSGMGDYVNIYLYADNYYDYNIFYESCKNLINELIPKLAQKQFKSTGILGKDNISICFKFCGYGINLNTKQLETYTFPLGSLNTNTNEFNGVENIVNKIDIDKIWFK